MRFIGKKTIILCGLLFVFFISNAGNKKVTQSAKYETELENVYGLAKRVLQGRADNFVFEFQEKKSSKDYFEISSLGKKILIKGTDGVSLASGLNWYLKKYCNSQFTIIDKHIALPEKLPLPSTPEKVETRFDYRYFFNVCTFSYTMAWWDWADWERQIDWMAMNGINFPLAITGQEAIWSEVYKELGLSQKQIDDYLVGPGYLPWSWMGNIDGLGGPLPKSWIETHKQLEQKILKRERALGMKPILQAFTGHVPESIKEIYPNAKLHKTGNWSAGFGGTYFLDPSDELFQRIGNLFIKKQTELYGTDHYYSADCFNEVNPDSDDPQFLSNMGKSVYQSMAVADPKAVWVMQAWFLYYSIDNFWKEPQVKSLLGAVPDDKLIMLDLYGEVHPVWKKQAAFYGKPWIWNVLQNFGGRTSMSGRLQDMATNLKDVFNSSEKGNFSGIGMAMEYFGNDPVVQEFVMSMVWEKEIPDVNQWLDNYVINRYGKKNEFALKAWQEILSTCYNSNKQTGTFLCERPGFYNPKLAYRTSPIPDYDPKILGDALDNLLKCSDEFKNLDTYQFDVVNLTRQFISPLAYYWILDLQDAYQKKDLNQFLKVKVLFINLIKDFDVLLATRKEYLLGRWVESAKKWGETKEEKDLYEFNARNLITLWGEKCTEGQYDDLNNYAYKQWAGMFTNYHLVRWNKFFEEVETALRKKENWDRNSFLESSCAWEKNWSHNNKNTFYTKPVGNPVEVSKRIFKKYLPLLINEVHHN
ncbi:MAG TPA: alpha-N-acetylglucosaminidase [Chitinophagaceae bacterium]|nr:alpha-N-acetylglucosaminidase [Chitinophagaceae bacterium]